MRASAQAGFGQAGHVVRERQVHIGMLLDKRSGTAAVTGPCSSLRTTALASRGTCKGGPGARR